MTALISSAPVFYSRQQSNGGLFEGFRSLSVSKIHNHNVGHVCSPV